MFRDPATRGEFYWLLLKQWNLDSISSATAGSRSDHCASMLHQQAVFFKSQESTFLVKVVTNSIIKVRNHFLTTSGANLGIQPGRCFEGQVHPKTSLGHHCSLVWTLGEVFLAGLGARGHASASALALNKAHAWLQKCKKLSLLTLIFLQNHRKYVLKWLTDLMPQLGLADKFGQTNAQVSLTEYIHYKVVVDDQQYSAINVIIQPNSQFYSLYLPY